MKKLFLVLALVAAYGVSMAMSGADINSVNTAADWVKRNSTKEI